MSTDFAKYVTDGHFLSRDTKSIVNVTAVFFKIPLVCVIF